MIEPPPEGGSNGIKEEQKKLRCGKPGPWGFNQGITGRIMHPEVDREGHITESRGSQTRGEVTRKQTNNKTAM